MKVLVLINYWDGISITSEGDFSSIKLNLHLKLRKVKFITSKFEIVVSDGSLSTPTGTSNVRFKGHLVTLFSGGNYNVERIRGTNLTTGDNNVGLGSLKTEDIDGNNVELLSHQVLKHLSVVIIWKNNPWIQSH